MPARTTHQNDSRWQAVATRDARADGAFVYAVESTGIYCRPSCASRRPTRSRVEFFTSPADAEARGFRACKRCRPGDLTLADPWIDKIRRACRCLAGADGRLSLSALARKVGGSPYHLHRNFTRLVGVTPQAFADASRLKKVKARLQQGADVTTAVIEAGYGSSSRFYERAAGRLGMAPSRYRQGGAEARIAYAIVPSPFGKLLVAATDRGICAISFGGTERELEDGLAAEYPAAARRRDRDALTGWVTQVLDHLQGRLPQLDLPLDVRATAFQWQVWTALGRIPRGETRSYRDVAAAIGRPRAVRAVARACAANRVAVAIPCHRVVPVGGGVGGYRWGADRKRKLLEEERLSSRSR